MTTKNNLDKNLQYLMQHYQLTETEIARRTDIGQPVVHRMAYGATDNPKIKTISPLANLFGLSISQLLTDLPPPEELQAELSDIVIAGWHPISLLTLSALTSGVAVAQKQSQQWAYTDIPPTSETFAIRLNDDAMAPVFPKRTLCIIEPTRQAKNEDFVVVVIQGEANALFRKILFHGDDAYLQALNPQFETRMLTASTQILGSLLQANMDLRVQSKP